MSERQKKIFEVIKAFSDENGYPPTIREICNIANIKSTSTVHGEIQRLKAKGYITSKLDRPRSIVVRKKEKKVKLIVNAIALKREDDKEYILLKENIKLKDKTNKFELPDGFISGSESVYGCLRRSLKAKGFVVTKIFGEDKCSELSNEDEAVTVFKPFCISQQVEGTDSIISNTILCEVDEVELERVNNNSRFNWICTDDLEDMLVDQKENISAHNIVALRSFCEL